METKPAQANALSAFGKGQMRAALANMGCLPYCIAQWQTPQDKPLARHAPVFRCAVNQVRCQPPVRVVTAGQMGSARAFCYSNLCEVENTILNSRL